MLTYEDVCKALKEINSEYVHNGEIIEALTDELNMFEDHPLLKGKTLLEKIRIIDSEENSNSGAD